MASLAVNIFIEELNATKAATVFYFYSTVQFSLASNIGDVISDCRKKYLPTADTEYGLFLVSEKKWLSPKKELKDYVLKPGELLSLRKTSRTLRVKLMDDTLKSFTVEEPDTVKLITASICKKMGE